MKAIETIYKNYRFRSRLEARYAVFFDTLGVKWEYEKEGFILGDDIRYLPDFYLPDIGCWVEVKGKEPTIEEQMKASMLAMSSNKPVYIFHDEMWIPGIDDTKEVSVYGGEFLEMQKKGHYCYSAADANLFGEDTTSPCSHKMCVHDRSEVYTCPYKCYVENIGEEGKLLTLPAINDGGSSFSDPTCHVSVLEDVVEAKSPEAFCKSCLLVPVCPTVPFKALSRMLRAAL